MLPQLSRYIIEKWDILFPNVNKPKKITYLGIAGSVEGGTTTFLAFSEESSKPVFVVRIPRGPTKINQIFAENDMLLYLYSLSPFLKNSIPRVILCKKIADSAVLVESVLDGKPMMAIIDSDGLPELEDAKTNIHLAKEWLLNLNNETKEFGLLTPDLIERYIVGPVEKFQTIFSLSKNGQDYLQQIMATMEGFIHHKIPLFLRHGDFCRHNILVSKYKTKYKVGVIDWAFSQRQSLPLYDILFFITTYFLQVRKEYGVSGYLKAFKDTFLEKNRYSNIVSQCLIEYCQELKIDLSLIRTFFTMFLVEKAISEYYTLLSISERGFIPSFGMYSEPSKKMNYRDTIKEQMWIYFFRTLVKEQKHFIIRN